MNLKNSFEILERKKKDYLNVLNKDLFGEATFISSESYVLENGFWFFWYSPFQNFLCEYEESLIKEAEEKGFDFILPEEDRILLIYNDNNIKKLDEIVKKKENMICEYKIGFNNNIPVVLKFKIRVNLF